MSVQQLAPPTIIEIARELREFEERNHMTTTEFLAVSGRVPEMDEDEAVEWFYRAEQLRVLQELGGGNRYSRSGRELSNCDSVIDLMDCLAA